MRRDAEASARWSEVYPHLSRDRGGLFGAITSRAEAHVLRVSCIYALLDRSATVRRCHLEAALAVWKYCEDSALFIFGTGVGNQVADRIVKALRGTQAGLTRTEIRDLFGGHRSSEEIGMALDLLVGRDWAECVKEGGGGRSAERWLAKTAKARKTPEGQGA
jgi:hypothetical protein